MKRVLSCLVCLAFLTFGATACRKVTTTNPPTAPSLSGACNTADSAMYQTLIFAQGSLLNLKATLASSATAQATVQQLTPYYTQAKLAYNLAEPAWQAYHAACLANAAASPAAAQSAVNNLNTAIQAVPKGK